MAESNVELLGSGYDAFAEGERDVAAVLALVAEDIAWHVSGRNPLGGDYTGHEEVGGFFQALGERSGGTFNLDAGDFFDNGEDEVVVSVTENAERNGVSSTSSALHVWRREDGKATKFQAFQGDDYKWDDFWA